MPKTSNKAVLLQQICENAALEVLHCSEKDVDTLLDDFLEDYLTVHNMRTTVPRSLVPKSDAWYRTVLPELDDFRFKQFVRVRREDFAHILHLIQDNPVFEDKNKKNQVAVEKQLAITLYKFGFDGTGSSLANTAGMFGVGDGGSVMKIVERVIQAILALEKEYLFWPPEDERKQMEELMTDALPKCVGFIDGTHIGLSQAPLDDHESYFTRKQRYTIQLQAVCDHQYRFRNIFVGYPGSVHDARVYHNSSIGKTPEAYFTNGQWIAGDSAYAVSPFLLTPFRENCTSGTVAERRKFNKYFSSHRVKIECAFGVLKEVFTSLKNLRIRVSRTRGHQLACKWIRACCVLYNIIRPSLEMHEDDWIEEEDDDAVSPYTANSEGEEKRETLFRFVLGKLNN